ncbi:hypothetical protein ACH5RR_012856 [Cinchona calisaya]|uniref:SWI/SNF complex subunit SWI3A n=1 Tax=Cinchona calisaya TaxID=153742 RepID=A0ABD3A8S4_9GENT
MEASNFKQSVPEEPHLDLYTIPSYSSWFQWGNIHEIERISLREFFDGSSITRTPRIYKEYRDFIICKYREDLSRRLTFTDVRKSLVGDVSTLHKVFTFLEKWGLINFSGTASSSSSSSTNALVQEKKKEVEDEKWRVRVEEGAPYGVRVVVAPNSLKTVTPPPPPLPLGVVGVSGGGEVAENGSKFPPLASYSDIYGELLLQQQQQAHQQPQGKELVLCGSCKEPCDSGHYEYIKEERFILCKKCFGNGDYGCKSVHDFKFIDGMNHIVVWTEAETLLLLESVLKHGDDWELVAQNVKTKSKLDCISKLLQLPFGDLMLGSALGKSKFWDTRADISSDGQAVPAAREFRDAVARDSQQHEHKHEDQQNAEDRGPPQKRLCTVPILDASSSLMKQVARLSAVVGPPITACAADAAVAELCYENRCSREIFDDDNFGDESGYSAQNNEERVCRVESSEGEKRPAMSELQETTPQKNVVPLTLRMRASTATCLGAAAAHAKLLADQEEREIEHLLAIVVETQLKKLQRKAKVLENLEVIMEKQHDQFSEFEEDIVAERMNVLQEIFSAGIPRWNDHTSVKSHTGNAL